MTEPDPDDAEFLSTSGIDPDSISGLPARRDLVAPLALRAFARAIDLLVVAVISLAVTVPSVGGPTDDVPTTVKLLSLAGWLVYEAGTVAVLGQTMGKRAVGLKVVTVGSGARPGVARSVLRAAVVPALVPPVGMFALLAYPTATIDPGTGRGLLDRLAGTAVVRV